MDRRCRGQWEGRLGAVGIGINGAYDAGLDHNDRLGRFTTLNMATSYTHEELLALLQVNDGGRIMRLDLHANVITKVDCELKTAFLLEHSEWRTSKHLKTRVSAQMDLRHC
ncbi:unnamed protein product [Peronospora destructor]|uniref:Uncharacterized protein n=1 Tax=Peronospora destructor TaxID=86335 RepID=A0AAV0UHK2_9STRA|nr:unnamed protein product [Peronospora destructor]